MKTPIILGLTSIIVIAGLLYHNFPIIEKYTRPKSRDFVSWMNTVPKDSNGNTGLKVLVQNINPFLTEKESNNLAIALTEAAKFFPNFCNTGNEKQDKMEFAAFLSNVGAETSFTENFPCTTERGCPDCKKCSYNSKGDQCLKNPKLQYYGRGPLQLSWDYNYARFSEYLTGDRNLFVEDPDLVTSEPFICWASAMWFWNLKQGYGGWCEPQVVWPEYNTCNNQCFDGPKGCKNPVCTPEHYIERGYISCHDAMHRGNGFGQLLALINGGYHCCETSTFGYNYGSTLYRQQWYIDIYHRWTGEYQYKDLSNITSSDCPWASKINCQQFAQEDCSDKLCCKQV